MPSDRLTARRRELQRQMEEANDRICANGRDLKKAFQQWVNAAHEDGLLAFLAQLADCYGRLVQRTPVDTGRPELLHFSYDGFDQQNFSDAALSMQLAAAAGGAIPTSTPWNAYRGYTAGSKGELVILQLTAETFVPIYAAALQHKAAKMAEGGQRKAAVAAAQTVEEVEAI